MNQTRFDVLSPDTAEGLTRCFDRLVASGAARGDYLEFGTYQGHSLLRAYREAERLGLEEMRFFAFDSFAGLPEPRGVDTLARIPLETGMFACSRDQVESNLVQNGVDMSRVRLIEGFYDQSLTPATKATLGVREAAIVLIDCDLYASARLAINFAADFLRDRTLLIFDDYEIFEPDLDKGERRAFSEFLSDHPELAAKEFLTLGWHGRAFELKRAGGRIVDG